MVGIWYDIYIHIYGLWIFMGFSGFMNVVYGSWDILLTFSEP